MLNLKKRSEEKEIKIDEIEEDEVATSSVDEDDDDSVEDIIEIEREEE